MNILIIGTGNCGITYAADLVKKGHNITLLKSSIGGCDSKIKYIVDNNNIVSLIENDCRVDSKIQKITNSYDDAFKNNHDVIIICSQTNYHEDIILNIKKFIRGSDIVLLEPGYASTAFFLKHGIECTIVEAQSSPIDCRVNDMGEALVLFRNVRNPVGIFSKFDHEEIKKILNSLDYNFFYLDSVVEAALHNPNLIVHTIGAIMSIPRIEYTNGEYWMYKEVFTPSVWNLVEKLDEEKNNILLEMGLSRLDYVDACKFRNFEDQTGDSKQAFFDYAMNSSPQGPYVSNSRYITEDVSQGLVMLESFGKMLNVKTEVTTSLINIASFSLKQDFRHKGRTVENLNLSKQTLDFMIKG